MQLEDWVRRAPPELREELDTLIVLALHGAVQLLKDGDISLKQFLDKLESLKFSPRVQLVAGAGQFAEQRVLEG